MIARVSSLPELEKSKSVELKVEELAQMLKSVSYAQSVNEERYMLKGVFFQMEKGNLSLVATDGRRLAVSQKQISNEEVQGEFILPSLTVSEIEKLPKTGEAISLYFTDRQVSFDLPVEEEKSSESGFVGSIYFVSKVVEGKYPNYKQVIPKDDFKEAKVERINARMCYPGILGF